MEMKRIMYFIIVIFTFSCFCGCGGKSSSESSGKYTNKDGSANQAQYQGSKEQQDDLNAINDYAKEHPDF